jgi:hypothetical protein
MTDTTHKHEDREAQVYTFLLDLFPLTDTIENATLADVLHRTALAGLTEPQQLQRLPALLPLARDRGYLDGEVAEYLLKTLRRMGAA